MKFGQVYTKDGKTYARFPNGRKTKSGRPSYTVRRVSSEAVGRKFLREVRKAQLAGCYQQDGPSLHQGGETVAQAVESYINAKTAEGRAASTLEQYGISLKAIRESGLGGMAVSNVTPDAVRAFLAWRRSHTWRTRTLKGGRTASELVKGGTASNAVLYRDRGLLAAVFRWLEDEGRVTGNPVRKVKPPRKRETIRRSFEPEELAAFLDACHPDYLRPLVLAGLYTGQGGRELIGIRWRDLSFNRKTLSVVREKNGRAIDIPLHPHLIEELRALKQRRAKAGRIPAADECVFLSRYGRPYRAFPRGAWNRAVDRAGLTGRELGPHSLRRTFATFYEGQDRDLQQILGHADLHTTLIYRKSRDDRARASVEALDYGLDPRTFGVPVRKSKAQ